MTDTLVQNVDIAELSEVNQYPNVAKTEADGSFSTLMTNISNKVIQTQSDFIDNVVKTNTSSINQYVLKSQPAQSAKQQTYTIQKNKNEVNSQDANFTANNAVNTTNTKSVENAGLKTAQNVTKPTTNLTDSKVKKQQSGSNTLDSIAKNNVNKTTQTQQSETSNVISNNKDYKNIDSGSLESSPSSFESNPTNVTPQSNSSSNTEDSSQDTVEKLEKEIQTVIENILITFDVPVSSNDESAIDVESALQNSEGMDSLYQDKIVKAIDDISSQIDNMNLSQDKKDEILNALDEIKNAMAEVKDDSIDDISKLFKQVKEEVFKDLKIPSNKNLNTSSEDLVSENTTGQTIDTPKEDIHIQINNEMKKLAETLKNSKVEKPVEPIVKDLEKISNEIQKNIENLDFESIDEKLSAALKQISKEFDSKDLQDVKPLIDKISELVEDAKVTVEKNIDVDASIKVDVNEINVKLAINKDTVKTEDLRESENQNFETDETLNSNNSELLVQKTNEIESKDTKKIDSEISSNTDKEYEIQDAENSVAKEDTVKQDTKVKSEKIVVKNDDKQEYKINTDSKKEEIKEEANNIEDTESEVKESDSVVKTANKGKHTNNNASQENKNLNIYETKQTKNSELKGSVSVEDAETVPENKADINTQSKQTDEIPDVEIEISEPLKPEMKVPHMPMGQTSETVANEANYAEETPSALTVADEVVKIALDNNNSLASRGVMGNVTYDPANSAVKIKNIQNVPQFQLKDTPKVQNNILNQIGEKLYQLKDSQKLTLILRPNDLGRLSVELTSDKNGLTTNIIAQNDTVRNYIEKNIHTLRSQLTEAGVNVNSIQIKTAGQDNTSTYEGNQHREFQQEQEQSQLKDQQQKQNNRNHQEKENIAQLQTYDMHFAKDFSSVLNKTLSYIS